MTPIPSSREQAFPLAAGLTKTRVWGSTLQNQTLIGASWWLSSTSCWGSGYRCDAIASGSTDQRYYASSYGRFNTADPYQASAGPSDPGSWNRYSYVQGDPANHTDRTGRFLDDNFSDSGIGDDLCGTIAGGCVQPYSSPCFFNGFMQAPGPGLCIDTTGQPITPVGEIAAPIPECPLVSLIGNFAVKGGVIALFAPDIAVKIDAALSILNGEGIVPTITDGFRTESMQTSRQGGAYGAAKVGQSSHEIGEAIDIRWLVPGTSNTVAGWADIKAALTGQGLTWGGTWHTPDPVHFENVHKPTAAQVTACEREHP